jgi:hypothetical protein
VGIVEGEARVAVGTMGSVVFVVEVEAVVVEAADVDEDEDEDEVD